MTERGPVMALVACLVVAGLTPFVAGTYLVGVALELLMWIALAESWILLSGMTGYISLGHAVFFGAGAYIMVLCFGILPFWLSGILAGLGTGLIAYSAADARAIIGHKSREIEALLGYRGRDEMIHRDDLVLDRTVDPHSDSRPDKHSG